MMEKRGQVTIFIIVGIILLVSIGLVFVFRSELISETKISYPAEVEPVAFAVRDCLQQKADEGLALLGSQAGYIYIPPQILDDSNLNADIGIKIPYWKKGDIVNIPSLDKMSFDLNKYIEVNLKDCMGNFSDFRDYEVIETSPLSVNTSIGDEAVVFSMNYPLKIRLFSDGSEYDISQFEYISNIKLKKLWLLSKEIMEKEIATKKLGDTTFDLMAMDTKIPVNGYDFSCDKKEWKISDVEDRLRKLLAFNLPLLRIKKTPIEQFPDEYEYMNTHYIWDATDFEYDDVSVSFGMMETEPLMMHVSPSKGEYIKSGVIESPDKNKLSQLGIDTSALLSLVCFQLWKFNYDVSYTAFANVLDESTGFKFTFLFDVNVEDNAPVDTSNVQVDYETYVEKTSNEDFCDDKVNDLTIYTNEFTNNDNYGGSLNNVELTFDCMQYSCDLGDSIPIEGASGLKVKLPRCTYGYVRANKEGFLDDEEVIEIGQEKVDINLVPIHKLNNFVVKKYIWNENINDWFIDDITGSDYALVSLRGSLNKGGESVDLGSSTTYPFEESVQNYLEIFSGSDVNYIVDVNLLRSGKVIGTYSGNWNVSWQDILLGEEVIIPVIFNSDSQEILNLNKSLIPEIEIR